MPIPDPAATVVLLRPTPTRFDVLMVERNARGFFGNLAVFPGGAVDDWDLSDGRRPDDAAHRRAALRELAEETGILLTESGPKAVAALRGPEVYEYAADQGLKLAIESLALVSRWVTPEAAPRRFDARFYLAAEDVLPDITLDTDELVGYAWMDPARALERHDEGEVEMILPTIAHLRWLARRRTVAEAFQSADGADGRTLIEPKRASDGSILPVFMPAEPA